MCVLCMCAVGPKGMALLFTWLRLSSMRQLDWYRNRLVDGCHEGHAQWKEYFPKSVRLLRFSLLMRLVSYTQAMCCLNGSMSRCGRGTFPSTFCALCSNTVDWLGLGILSTRKRWGHTTWEGCLLPHSWLPTNTTLFLSCLHCCYCSNYQSKDIAHVQKTIAERMADKARSSKDVRCRAYARMVLEGLPRGGGNGWVNCLFFSVCICMCVHVRVCAPASMPAPLSVHVPMSMSVCVCVCMWV